MADAIISVKSLKKCFNGFCAVDGISFDVKQGEIFAFLGPNGAGKTTTIKMLTTLMEPTAGDVAVAGFDPRIDQDSVRNSFGIAFQDASLDEELTAYENMDFHAMLYGLNVSERRKKIDDLLKFVGLLDRKDEFVKKFSGGMKRRLEIARALIHAPRILFLDEPTLGLDPQTRNSIWEYIVKLNKKHGMTVFFTTHYMEEAEKTADTVAIMDHGRIIKQGSPRELMRLAKKDSLEAAFLKFTGSKIRDEESSGTDLLRIQRRAWRR